MKRAALLMALLCGCAALNGCLVVTYSSRTGVGVWSGSLVVTLVAVVLWLLFRGR